MNISQSKPTVPAVPTVGAQSPARTQLITGRINARTKKLSYIHNENEKIFYNLKNIKSSISRQNFKEHEQRVSNAGVLSTKISNLKVLLEHGKNKVDPLLAVEKIQKQTGKRSITPFQRTTFKAGLANNGTIESLQSTEETRDTHATARSKGHTKNRSETYS